MRFIDNGKTDHTAASIKSLLCQPFLPRPGGCTPYHRYTSLLPGGDNDLPFPFLLPSSSPPLGPSRSLLAQKISFTHCARVFSVGEMNGDDDLWLVHIMHWPTLSDVFIKRRLFSSTLGSKGRRGMISSRGPEATLLQWLDCHGFVSWLMLFAPFFYLPRAANWIPFRLLFLSFPEVSFLLKSSCHGGYVFMNSGVMEWSKERCCIQLLIASYLILGQVSGHLFGLGQNVIIYVTIF